MSLEDEETYRHGAVGLRKQRVRAVEELFESDEIAQRFAHLGAVDGDHVVVHPVADSGGVVVSHGLSYLAFVVGELEVHTATVDVELLTEVLLAHGRALKVPSRETFAPGRGPVHDMLGGCFLPEGEVGGVTLFGLTVKLARSGQQLVDVTTGELAVAIVGVELGHVEVHRTVADVGIACVEDGLDVFDLLDDVSGSVRLDGRGKNTEGLHGLVVPAEVVLHHLHRFELLEARLLGDLVFALVGIVLEVSHVGDIADVAHLVAQMGEVADEDVEGDGGTGMTQMRVAVDGRTAYVQTHIGRVQGLEELLAAAHGVIDGQLMRFHRCDSFVLSGFEGVGDTTFALSGSSSGLAVSDGAECFLEAGDVLAEGVEEGLGVLGSHDYAGLNLGLGHVGSHHDEVHEEFAGGVGDNGEVAIVAGSHFGSHFDLEFLLFGSFHICAEFIRV